MLCCENVIFCTVRRLREPGDVFSSEAQKPSIRELIITCYNLKGSSHGTERSSELNQAKHIYYQGIQLQGNDFRPCLSIYHFMPIRLIDFIVPFSVLDYCVAPTFALHLFFFFKPSLIISFNILIYSSSVTGFMSAPLWLSVCCLAQFFFFVVFENCTNNRIVIVPPSCVGEPVTDLLIMSEEWWRESWSQVKSSPCFEGKPRLLLNLKNTLSININLYQSLQSLICFDTEGFNLFYFIFSPLSFLPYELFSVVSGIDFFFPYFPERCSLIPREGA